MKPVKIDNEEIKKAISSGDSYIQVGNRKFLLFEVNEIKEPNVYQVTDSEEEKEIIRALKGDNPILTDEEIHRMLGSQK